MAATSSSITPETLITIKVSLYDAVKKLKLPLRDLTPTTLPDKLRTCLNINAEQTVIFERYSDSFGGFITLNPANAAVFKALVRAAKAKGKLRLKASIIPPDMQEEQEGAQAVAEEAVSAPECSEHLAQQFRASGLEHLLPHRHRGSGIFQFRESRASQQTLVSDEAPVPEAAAAAHTLDQTLANDEAPVPQPFTPRALCSETRQTASQACQELAFRTREPTEPSAACSNAVNLAAWSVYCNICDMPMADIHYHCSICDGGDYDLCEKCVSDGNTCQGDDHWLIKRSIKDGKVVTSTTERVVRKESAVPEVENTMPGAFAEMTKVLAQEPEIEPTRTCNNCVIVLPEHEFVTCNTCEDFDLCIECHGKNTHGHHPGHAFQPATANTVLNASSKLLLTAGRNVEHNAFCDGCNEKILGIRHKCLQCPDWDYCNTCITTASTAHPRHRFAAIYDQLAEPRANYIRHFGIFCDGPLCSKQDRPNYIQGVRYKCAVCHDTDFCATCEALPGNHHNRTHPLIKFTTPVRNVNITTLNEDIRGNVRSMGDKPAVKSEPVPQNAAIPVQTVAEITPTEEKTSRKMPQPLDGDVTSTRTSTLVPASMLNATFVRDSIADGTIVAPGSQFTQIWTLRNEGPHVWPAGCSVRYVGGDNMLNVDNGHPASVSLINAAIESSIVAREVLVGEEIAFRITLKAPMREGKSISYWRLKAADGTPFGHRLWCDIEVRSAKPASPPQQVPAFAPTKNELTPLSPDSVASHRQQQSRLQAMRQHQLRLLHQQTMLRHTRAASTVEPEYVPYPSMRRTLPAPMMLSSEEELKRKESARARMESIRARVLQARAEALKSYSVPKECPSMEAKSTLQIPEPEVSKPEATTAAAEPITGVSSEAEIKSQELTDSANSSLMIFPKLDKESPASSIVVSSKGQAAYVQNEEGEVEQTAGPHSPSTIAAPSVAEPSEEGFDDLELLSLSAASDDEEDDGFLTDEEYDILDASDRETVV